MTRARNSANLASDGNLFVDIANDRTGIGSVAPAQNLHVAGTAGFHGDTTFVGDSYNATWDRSENKLKFDEFSGIRLGNNNELQIDHRGTSYILNIDNMPLQIGSNSLQLMNAGTTQTYLNASLNSDLLLYRAGSERFRTKDYGVQITGTTDTDGLVVSGVATVTTMNVTGVLTYDDVTSVDSVGIVTARQGVRVTADGSNTANYISVGASNDLQLFHNGTNSHIRNNAGALVLNADSLYLQSLTENYLTATANGAVELFHNNIKKFETTSTGVSITGVVGIDNTSSTSDVGLRVTNNSTSAFSTSENIEGTTNRKITPLMLRNGGPSGSTETYLGFDAGHSSKAQWNIGVKKTGALQGDFIFNTRTGSSTSAERLRITSGGRVGINTNIDSMDGVTGNLNIANTNINNHTVINLSRITTADRSQIRFSNPNGNIGSIDTFNSDLIMSSGNDLIFRTNSTERARIASDGKIGIGDFGSGTSLSYPLHLKNAMGSSPSFIHMEVTGSNTVGGGGGIAFDTSASNNSSSNTLFVATIAGVRTSDNNGSNDLVFSTTKSGVNSDLPLEKLRITSSGNIGINSTAPSATLEVHDIGSTGPCVLLRGATSTEGDVTVPDGESFNFGHWNYSSSTFTERLRIDSSGHLSLPVDNQKLRLGASGDLELFHNGSNSYIDNNTGNLYVRSSGGQILFRPNNSEDALVLKPDGAVELYHNNVKMFETTSTGASCAGAITAVGAFLNGDVQFTGDNYNIRWDKSENTLEFLDDAILAFGNSDDFTIKHVSSDSTTRLIEVSGGSLFVQAGNFVVTNPAGNEFMINAAPDGAVNLYHNNVKKLETYANGVVVTGTVATDAINLNDNARAYFGTGADLSIYHDGSNSFIKDSGTGGIYLDASFFHVRQGSAESMINAVADAQVELYHNGTKKFQTSSEGVDVVSGHLTLTDNYKARFGASLDLQIYHDGSNSRISDNGTGNLILDGNEVVVQSNDNSETQARFISNGAVELYHNNSKKLETHSTNGVQFPAGLQSPDNQALRLGSSNDLLLYHDGTSSVIKNTTGHLYIQSINDLKLRTVDSELAVNCIANGAVELYYNASKKLETTNNGLRTSGELIYMGPNNITNFIHSGGNISLTADTSLFFVCDCNDTSGTAPSGEFIFGGGSNTNTDSNQDFTTAEFGNSGQPRNQYMLLDENQLKLNSSIRWYSNNVRDIGTNATKTRRIYVSDLVIREGNNPSGSITAGGGSASREVIKFSVNGFTVHHDNATLSTAAAFSSLCGSRSQSLFRLRNNSSGAAIYSESGSISSASDYRIKENVVGITSAISTVKTLNPVSYNIKKSWNPEDDGVREHGFIAHEVAESIPDIKNIVGGVKDAVNEDGSVDAQGLDYGRMTPVLTAAIKELIAKVETLEARIAVLEG